MNKILYLGPKSGTSKQRASALVRSGHNVDHISVHDHLPKRWASWLYHGGGWGLDKLAARAIRTSSPKEYYDVIIVDNGDVIGHRSMEELRKRSNKIVNYNPDNPYIDPSPEKYRWSIMRKVMDQYDICVAIRREGIKLQMQEKGVRSPLLIWQTADEEVHRRPETIEKKWKSEVCFVGTWMPGRGNFIKTLRDKGVPVTVYGHRWNKSSVYESIRDCVHIGHLEGKDYSCALAGSKIGIVMLNQQNADLHTKRSIEIPALQVAMCAVDTPYHRELYDEETEAVFYKDANECAERCLDLLKHDEKRNRMARMGHERCLKNGTWNEKLMQSIIEKAISS